MQLSKCVQGISPSPTLSISALAEELRAQGKDVINLSSGEPDFDTPTHIKDAGKRAMDMGYTKYTAVDGLAPLKEAIKETLYADQNLNYDTEEIIVTSGAKQALFNALKASLNPGDEVIIPAPCWVSYEPMVILMGGTPIIISCPKSTQFKLTPDLLESSITDKTRWLILNAPGNPSGAVYTKAELFGLADVLRKHPNISILSDDIYSHILYPPAQFFSLPIVAPDLKGRTLTINGVSKSFSMTGWRIGYAAGPVSFIKAMKKIQSQSTSSACTISQHAAIEALRGPKDFLEESRNAFKKRRDFLVQALNAINGLTCDMPEGAFYAYPSCAGFIGTYTPKGSKIETDKDFASYLLEEALVATVPGIAFQSSPHIRLSYAVSMETLQKAVDRIAQACKKLNS